MKRPTITEVQATKLLLDEVWRETMKTTSVNDIENGSIMGALFGAMQTLSWVCGEAELPTWLTNMTTELEINTEEIA